MCILHNNYLAVGKLKMTILDPPQLFKFIKGHACIFLSSRTDALPRSRLGPDPLSTIVAAVDQGDLPCSRWRLHARLFLTLIPVEFSHPLIL